MRVWGEDNSTVKTDKYLNAEKAFKLLFFNDSRDFYSTKNANDARSLCLLTLKMS